MFGIWEARSYYAFIEALIVGIVFRYQSEIRHSFFFAHVYSSSLINSILFYVSHDEPVRLLSQRG
jgi:hypothetical protein